MATTEPQLQPTEQALDKGLKSGAIGLISGASGVDGAKGARCNFTRWSGATAWSVMSTPR